MQKVKIKSAKQNKLFTVLGLVSLIVIIALAFTSVFLQKQLNQSFDTRRDASTIGAEVLPVAQAKYSLNPDNSVDLKMGVTNTITVNVNSFNNQIDGIQIFMVVKGDGNMLQNGITLTPSSINGLDVTVLDSQPFDCGPNCNYGRLIRMIAITEDPLQPFSTNNQYLPIFTISFNPVSIGSLTIDANYNTEIANNSYVTRNQDNLVIPLLSSSDNKTYQVLDQQIIVHPIDWHTPHAYLTASDFYLEIGDRRYFGEDAVFTVQSLPPTPPNHNRTNLEATWQERGREVKVVFGFLKDTDGWWVEEVKSYEQNSSGWLYYPNATNIFSKRAMGQEYSNNEPVTLTTTGATLFFNQIKLRSFLQPEPAQCAYQYSDWSNCVNGWQTRTYSIQPDGCYWYNPAVLEELARTCQVAPTTTPEAYYYFMAYSYQTCWSTDQNGSSLLFAWDENVTDGITWIDIADNPSFINMAHKNVQSDKTAYYGWYMTNGMGFYYNDNGKPFVYKPDTRYYVRLFNGYSHSAVLSFYMPKCGIGDGDYQQCNENCNNNRDCDLNLTCYNGQCRLASNPESSVCAPKPDQGLNRSCNEYCADSRECQTGYTCWWNRCRNPQNLEDTYCRAKVTKATTYYYNANTAVKKGEEVTLIGECSDYCRTNSDCPVNHRCYYNQCRLASNPESKTCDPNEVIMVATPSILLTPSPTSMIIDDESTKEGSVQKEETAWDTIKNFFNFSRFHLSPVVWILLGGGLLLVIAFILLVANSQPEYQSPTTYHAPTGGLTGTQTTMSRGYASNLANQVPSVAKPRTVGPNMTQVKMPTNTVRVMPSSENKLNTPTNNNTALDQNSRLK